MKRVFSHIIICLLLSLNAFAIGAASPPPELKSAWAPLTVTPAEQKEFYDFPLTAESWQKIKAIKAKLFVDTGNGVPVLIAAKNSPIGYPSLANTDDTFQYFSHPVLAAIIKANGMKVRDFSVYERKTNYYLVWAKMMKDGLNGLPVAKPSVDPESMKFVFDHQTEIMQFIEQLWLSIGIDPNEGEDEMPEEGDEE